MSPSPLPSITAVNFDAEGLNVWHLLLDAEKEALDTSIGLSAKYNDNLIGVRVLGFFLKDFWDYRDLNPFGLTPYKRLLLELNSCNRIDNVAIGRTEESQARMAKVFKLGLDYRNQLMRIFRADTSPLPTPSTPGSWDIVRGELITAMSQAPTTKKDTKKQALCRDGYKCVISGVYDTPSYLAFSELRTRAKVKGRVYTAYTEVAYLFSESTQEVKSPEHTAGAFTILDLFGIPTPPKLLSGLVNDLSNVLTMTGNLHAMFDNFSFWLEPVLHHLHTYDICFKDIEISETILEHPPRRVTFEVDSILVEAWNGDPPKDKDGNLIPLPSLPDPSLIALRATCARVAHCSGAVEQALQILEDQEDTEVMANDGGSANLLSSLLLRNSSTRVNAGI